MWLFTGRRERWQPRTLEDPGRVEADFLNEICWPWKMIVWACSVTSGPTGRQASQGPGGLSQAHKEGQPLSLLMKRNVFFAPSWEHHSCGNTWGPRGKQDILNLRVLARLSNKRVSPQPVMRTSERNKSLTFPRELSRWLEGRELWKSADVIILIYSDTSVWPSTVASKLIFNAYCMHVWSKFLIYRNYP